MYARSTPLHSAHIKSVKNKIRLFLAGNELDGVLSQQLYVLSSPSTAVPKYESECSA